MSGSRLIELMQKQANDRIPFGIELATVVSPPPSLKIRIDNMDLLLEGDDLIVCEHLLDHQRVYSTVTNMDDSAVSFWEETTDHFSEYPDPDQLRHKHDHKVEQLTINHQTVTIHTNLEAGSRVSVMALPGEQQYLVWDRVVIMGG